MINFPIILPGYHNCLLKVWPRNKFDREDLSKFCRILDKHNIQYKLYLKYTNNIKTVFLHVREEDMKVAKRLKFVHIDVVVNEDYTDYLTYK